MTERRLPGIALRFELVILFLLVVAYGLIQWHGLLSPGPLCDEANYGVEAQTVIHLGLRGIISWPLTMGYHGALQVYLYVPFLLLIKDPQFALRSGEVFFGLIVLLMSYSCTRRFFNPFVAIFTTILLLTNPVFIYMSRVSAAHNGVTTVFYLGALLCLYSWRESNKNIYLFAAAFLMGAGLCTQLWFYWFFFGLFLTAIVFCEETHALLNRPQRLRFFASVGSFFLLGFALYIVREIAVISGHLDAPELLSYGIVHLRYTKSGTDNLAVFSNLSASWRLFVNALAGVTSPGYIAAFPLVRDKPFIFLLEIYSIFALSFSTACLLEAERKSFSRRALFFITLLAGMFLPSCVTLSGISQTHLFILFPLPQIIMGAAAYLLLKHAWEGGRGRVVAILAFLFLAVCPVINTWEFSRMETFVRATGGTGESSDASVAMTGWLMQQHYLEPKIGVGGIPETIRFLSNEEIEPVDCYPGSNMTEIKDEQGFFARCLDSGDNIFIFPTSSKRALSFGPSSFAFLTMILKKTGKKFIAQKTFFSRDGQPVYTAWKLSESHGV